MNVFLLASIISVITFFLFIPFINLLYRLKMQDPYREKERKDVFGQTTEIFDELKAFKAGTPTGGGVLIVLVNGLVFSIIFLTRLYELSFEKYLIFMMVYFFFGLIGFYDDFRKVFQVKNKGLRVRHKLLIQFSSAALISWWGVSNNLFFIDIPFSDIVISNFWILFLVSMLTIIFMSNAFNILDGIDGLSSGSLLITLIPLTVFVSSIASNLTEMVFIYLLFGSALAYLYFNISPARVFMGDTGALSFGAIIGLLTMLTGTLYLLPLFGIVYIVDAMSSLIQWSSKYLRNGKKVFKIAPIHHHFEAIGWESTKVVFRFWIVNIFFSLLAIGIFVWVN
ncbi:phospho-N-acetylmuramoyl-pentapeptide-transferase [Patescibacteria group bacterium]